MQLMVGTIEEIVVYNNRAESIFSVPRKRGPKSCINMLTPQWRISGSPLRKRPKSKISTMCHFGPLTPETCGFLLRPMRKMALDMWVEAEPPSSRR